jgi:hypothetical protein
MASPSTFANSNSSLNDLGSALGLKNSTSQYEQRSFITTPGSNVPLIDQLRGSSNFNSDLDYLMGKQAAASKEATQQSVAAQKELLNAKAGGMGGTVKITDTGKMDYNPFDDPNSFYGRKTTTTATFSGSPSGGGGNYGGGGGGGSGGGGGGGGGRGVATGTIPGYAEAQQRTQNQMQVEQQKQMNAIQEENNRASRAHELDIMKQKSQIDNDNQLQQFAQQSQLEDKRSRTQAQLEDQRYKSQSQMELQKIGAQNQANMQSSMMQGMFGMMGSAGGGSSGGYRYW